MINLELVQHIVLNKEMLVMRLQENVYVNKVILDNIVNYKDLLQYCKYNMILLSNHNNGHLLVLNLNN